MEVPPPQTKNRSTLWPSNSASGNTSKGNENTHPKRRLYPRVDSSIIYNGQDVETTSVATARWRVKQSQCGVVNDATAGIHTAVQRPAQSREPTPRVLVARRVFSRLTVFTRDAGRSFIVRGTFHSVCTSDRHAGHLTLRSRRDVKYFSVTRGKTSLIRISF